MGRSLSFDETKCTRDGICVSACPSNIIQLDDGAPVPHRVSRGEPGCVQCGHCVVVCPHGAVSLASMKPEDCPPVQPGLALSVDHVEHLLRSRRSIRSFQPRTVDRATLQRLIEIARYAPTGRNAQPVRWVAIDSPAGVKRVAAMAVDFMRSIIDEVRPTELPARGLVEAWDHGVDVVGRDAPAMVIAYAPADNPVVSVDPILAMSYLEIAALSFGLGACWGGFLMVAISQWPPLGRMLGLPEGRQAVGAVTLGYPKHEYLRLPTRREPRITWIE